MGPELVIVERGQAYTSNTRIVAFHAADQGSDLLTADC
jgi:hypothetical protein